MCWKYENTNVRNLSRLLEYLGFGDNHNSHDEDWESDDNDGVEDTQETNYQEKSDEASARKEGNEETVKPLKEVHLKIDAGCRKRPNNSPIVGRNTKIPKKN